MIVSPADLINGSFELFGSIFNCINIKRIIRDKRLDGVSWVPTMFFTTWGFWNLYYYPSPHQMISFVGGLGIVISNFTWLYFVWYYHVKASRNEINKS